MSPIVWCAPMGLKFKKPVVCQFDHTIRPADASHWKVHLYAYRKLSSHNYHWDRLLTLGEERVDTPAYLQLDGDQVRKGTISYLK